jgi:copper chaperone CopZ
MYKRIIISFMLFIALKADAQFSSAIVGVDGLTCSACAFSTEKSIRQLEFVDSVKMELSKNMATVYFKKGAPVSIKALAQKVVDAGFAVRSIDAIFEFKGQAVSDGHCMEYENNVYHFIGLKDKRTLDGIKPVQFVGDKFMSRKEFKNWKMLCSNTCKPASPLATEYFVTLR